jgi:oligopeptide/dipeptide ABC transporter ATP-binding protein
MSAIPRPDPRPREKRVLLTGEVANPANPPSGCYFHPRCTYCIDICKTEEPFREIKPGHFVKCHRAEELKLTGAVDIMKFQLKKAERLTPAFSDQNPGARCSPGF